MRRDFLTLVFLPSSDGHVFYDMSVATLGPEAKKEGPLYAKLYAVEKAMASENPRHDWVFWSDADSMFINANKRLIDIIDDRFHIIATATLLAPTHGGYKIPNTGSFFVRNSPEGRQFLKDWMAAGRTEHQSKGWGDQGSLVPCFFSLSAAGLCRC